MAEAAYSQRVCTITLTYGPRDDLADKVINPAHFQLFMKRLRKAGHKVRYLVAGEYGELKGRVHFHAILFFEELVPLQYKNAEGDLITRGIVPRYIDDYQVGWGPENAPFCSEIPHKKMVHLREWPHGHVSVDWSASEESVRYVCKYLQKYEGTQVWFSLSKKPALGAAFFADKAQQALELGVLPQTWNYLPPSGNKDKSYYLRGASRRDYLLAMVPEDIRPRFELFSKSGHQERVNEWVVKSIQKALKREHLRDLAANPLSQEEWDRAFIEDRVDQQRVADISAEKIRKEEFWREAWEQFEQEHATSSSPHYEDYF